MMGAAAPESGVALNLKLLSPLLNFSGNVGVFFGVLPSHWESPSSSSSADDVDTLLTRAGGAVVAFPWDDVGYFHLLYSMRHTFSTWPFLLHFLHWSVPLSVRHALFCGSMTHIVCTFHSESLVCF